MNVLIFLIKTTRKNVRAYDSQAVPIVTGVWLKQLEITADNNKTVNSRLR